VRSETQQAERAQGDGGDEGKPWSWRRPLSLPEQIAAQINEAILGGLYVPGDPVREQDIATKFGVSRGPVREALRILEQDGVVQILPNRGASVTRLSIREVRDIFEIRAALTAVAVGHICDAAEPDVIRRLCDGADRLERLAEDPEARDDYVRESAAMARLIAGATGNERLTKMLLSLALQTVRYTQLGLATQARRRASAAIWHKTTRAAAAGDTAAARDHIAQLIMDSRDAAVAAIEAEEGQGK